MNSTPPKICVVGSLNMDLVVNCPYLPQPGETITADCWSQICGGKGANQAVAAANAGGSVAMIGRVGEDEFGQQMIQNLQSSGVHPDGIQSTTDLPSGIAIIGVDASGQNSIMAVPGANGGLSQDDIAQSAELIANSDTLLLQLEVPMPTVLAAMKVARQNNTTIILDPAPAPESVPEEFFQVDLICPNETEAASLTNQQVTNITQAESAARALHQRGAAKVVITLGDQGSLFFDGKAPHQIAAFPTLAVDTTAAGDAFAGALAVHWHETGDLETALKFASAAGAIAASRHGAQPSLPMRAEVERLANS